MRITEQEQDDVRWKRDFSLPRQPGTSWWLGGGEVEVLQWSR